MYILGLDDTDPQYVEMKGYECTKKVLDKRKRPLLFLRVEKAKKICNKMHTCMGIMKANCFTRSTRLYLCESGDRLKLGKWNRCVSKKVPGMYSLIKCSLLHLKLSIYSI